MHKSTPLSLSFTVLLIVSLACILPGVPVSAPTMDVNAVGTAIMQTMIVAATQTTGAAVEVAEKISTSTPEPPTLTPTITLSPTPLLTNTPTIPIVSVATNTNCRTGPGQAYERVGALMIGETAEVLARDPSGRYLYIRNPDRENGYCWLWLEYATVSGNVDVLPKYTPPPTPTPLPGFEAAYDGLVSCSGWWVNIQLTNTGGIPFQSMALSISDLSTNADLTLRTDKFVALDGCHTSFTKDVLSPGESVSVSTAAFSHDPRGHKLRATITLCSADGQNGACITKAIKFTP